MERLWVWFPPRLIGALEHSGATDGFSFRYDPTWNADREKSAFALSLSLPLGESTFRKEASAFFTNLLPEGSARENLCRKMGISVDNDFELLRWIGRDCAGALVLTEEERLPQESPTLEEITLPSLEKWLKVGSGGLLDLQVNGDLRMSLAGAQDAAPRFSEWDVLPAPRIASHYTYIETASLTLQESPRERVDSEPSRASAWPAHRALHADRNRGKEQSPGGKI